jgi:hypothetical protein
MKIGGWTIESLGFLYLVQAGYPSRLLSREDAGFAIADLLEHSTERDISDQAAKMANAVGSVRGNVHENDFAMILAKLKQDRSQLLN